ncbi:hypothetical protein [Acidithiobacillus sp. IBUN Pt1247-S3]|uniref:hypothetical protein n=1 Tax=Acidithiobacillus sp. IBUN Pt1247-S3 TaxID=3166642 RepID=UPI0034E3C347
MDTPGTIANATLGTAAHHPAPRIPHRRFGYNQAVPSTHQLRQRGPKIHGGTLHVQAKGVILMVDPQNR